LDKDKNSRICGAAPRRRKQRDCADVKVCAKGIKTKVKTLDGADFVRDVEKSLMA
jgi:hypothetical protein